MRNLWFVLSLAALFGVLAPFSAQEPAANPPVPAPVVPPAKIKVGIFDRPPFAMKDANGHWKGVAVELWEQISKKLNIPYEYVEVPLENIITELSQGKIDVAVGELGITPARMRLVDFTQPYIVNRAAAAFHKGGRYPSIGEIYNELTSHGMLLILLIMFGTLLLFSFILWFFERGVKSTHFGGKPIHGVGSAIWFSAVTMTTVGYGDKTPQSLMGRFLAFIWMFFSIVLVTAFTATVTASMTVSRINSSIDHPSQLANYINGAQKGSIGADFLNNLGIPAETFESVEDGMKALAGKKITAFVADEISLHFIVQRNYSRAIRLAPFASLNVRFAMATRPNFPLHDEIDDTLVQITDTQEWQNTVTRWLGANQAVNL